MLSFSPDPASRGLPPPPRSRAAPIPAPIDDAAGPDAFFDQLRTVGSLGRLVDPDEAAWAQSAEGPTRPARSPRRDVESTPTPGSSDGTPTAAHPVEEPRMSVSRQRAMGHTRGRFQNSDGTNAYQSSEVAPSAVLAMELGPIWEGRGPRPAASDGEIGRMAKARKRGMSLPRLAARKTSSVSSQSVQTPSPHDARPLRDIAAAPARHLVKDSMDTQQTGSSVYPLSGPTDSLPSPVSPMSFLEMDKEDAFSAAMEADILEEEHHFDADDISYRLRLLMSNSYFLPPAHAKPSLAELTPLAAKAPKPTPTFLDLFRKSKSKPPSPVPQLSPVLDISPPILRTTSDSGPRPTPHWANQELPMRPRASQDQRANRVVVVRETLEDLERAAKQAEQEVRAHRKVFVANPSDFVDPTDTVDVAPPPPGYPLALQTSALHGLGVGDSLGAAVLADRLPPGSPGWTTTEDSEDHAWRKDLLHQAVSFSLNNTPNATPNGSSGHRSSASTSAARQIGLESTPTPVPATPQTSHSPSPHGMLVELGQRILDPKTLESQTRASTPSSSMRRRQAAASPMPRSPGTQMLSIQRDAPAFDPSPPRAETPVGPNTPLAPPPPRKQLFNPLYSLSQTDLSSPTPVGEPLSTVVTPMMSWRARHNVRRSVSSPVLHNSYDTGPSLTEVRGERESFGAPPQTSSPLRDSVMSSSPPPDIPHTNGPRDFRTQHHPPSITSGSHYSQDEDDGVSVYSTPPDGDLTESRQSLSAPNSMHPRRSTTSEYSRPSLSPSHSTFQDGVTEDGRISAQRSPSPFAQKSFGMASGSRASRFSFASTATSGAAAVPPSIPQSAIPPSSIRPDSRFSTMSPPPRPSSSFKPAVLNPPPRGKRIPVHRRSPLPIGISTSISSSRPSLSSTHSLSSAYYSSQFASSSMQQILAPEPGTPPLPAGEIPADADAADQSSPDFFGTMDRDSGHPPITLTIPNRYSNSGEMHSAPDPSSPTAFFDHIEMQPSMRMDSDESEEEEDGEGEEDEDRLGSVYLDARTHASSSQLSLASSAPSIMRLGNHSTPQLGTPNHSSDAEDSFLPLETPQRRRGIGNIAKRPQFFTRRKKDAPTTPLDFYQYAQSASATSLHVPELAGQPSLGSFGSSGSRPQSRAASENEAHERARTRPVKSRESLRRLDGMLMQHMEAERDQLKRIATTMSRS